MKIYKRIGLIPYGHTYSEGLILEATPYLILSSNSHYLQYLFI